MSRTAYARIAGFTFLFYIVVGLTGMALSTGANAHGAAARLATVGQQASALTLILQHLIDLPIRVENEPVPKFMKKGDERGQLTWKNGRWIAHTRPDGLLVGLIQSVASPGGNGTSYSSSSIHSMASPTRVSVMDHVRFEGPLAA